MRGFAAIAGLVGVVALTLPATAANWSLNEYAFNINGTVSNITAGDPLPGEVNTSGLDTATGLGTVTVSVSGPGAYYIGMFVDHDYFVNFFNGVADEYGNAVGAAAAGQSWEIDEPGWVFGDIYTNFSASALDNTNGVPSTDPDDVSMALAWSFTLNPGESALVTFLLSPSSTIGSLALVQFDPLSSNSFSFSSSLKVQGTVIPLPPAMVLFGSGLVAFAALKRRGVSKR
jgi:hypothetical protein